MTAIALARLGPLQAFTAGYVDTVGYVGLFGLFTAHVTGNLVLIGASLEQPHSGLIAKLSALPVFVAAVAATSLFLEHCGASGRNPGRGLFGAQTLFLAIFMAAALAAQPLHSGDQLLALLAGLAGVAAMAVQNAASRTAFGALAPTTVMTGNVTQLVLDLMKLSRPGPDRPALVARFRKTAPPLAAFAAGAIAGGLLFSRLGFWCLGAPIAVVALLTVLGAPHPTPDLRPGTAR